MKMASIKYTVKLDGAIVAEHVDFEIAIILVEGIFQKYNQQAACSTMEVTIASEAVPDLNSYKP